MRSRCDLSALNEAEAVEALRTHQTTIESEARYYARRSRDEAVDLEDLRAVAQVAVLEALVTFDASRTASEGTWVRLMIRWRLQDALRREQATEAVDAEALPNGRTPGQIFEAMEARVWWEQEVGRLPPRDRVIVAATAQGETIRQIAHTLGLTASTACRARQRAYDTLRRRALEAGVAEE